MPRLAKCVYYPKGGKYGKCPEPVESKPTLAFFEDRNEGSKWAVEHCRCGFRDIAHADIHEINPFSGRPNKITDHAFDPRGASEMDAYFCGCWGWD